MTTPATTTAPQMCEAVYPTEDWLLNCVPDVDMKWIEALKAWNTGKTVWCIPRKGTPAYDEVRALMAGKPAEAPKVDVIEHVDEAPTCDGECAAASDKTKKCPFCGKSFKNLRSHIVKMHESLQVYGDFTEDDVPALYYNGMEMLYEADYSSDKTVSLAYGFPESLSMLYDGIALTYKETPSGSWKFSEAQYINSKGLGYVDKGKISGNRITFLPMADKPAAPKPAVAKKAKEVAVYFMEPVELGPPYEGRMDSREVWKRVSDVKTTDGNKTATFRNIGRLVYRHPTGTRKAAAYFSDIPKVKTDRAGVYDEKKSMWEIAKGEQTPRQLTEIDNANAINAIEQGASFTAADEIDFNKIHPHLAAVKAAEDAERHRRDVAASEARKAKIQTGSHPVPTVEFGLGNGYYVMFILYKGKAYGKLKFTGITPTWDAASFAVAYDIGPTGPMDSKFKFIKFDDMTRKAQKEWATPQTKEVFAKVMTPWLQQMGLPANTRIAGAP